ncbi:MAG: hypothetical protein ACOYIE_08780 [Agathobaculum sp.]|jgi:hypothetical protein|uniref:hypothetical protein n=1 Tax=Agathobaculum sp. TaxID=2048138 RepID=UPI003D92C228
MKIKVAFNKKLIGQDRAIKVSARRARRQGADTAAQPQVELRYKRLYFIKLLGLAARTPFEPKKIDYTLFYDPVMNQGGLTDCVPACEECEVDENRLIAEKYTLKDYEKQKDQIIEKNILRSYLLKRPEIRYVDTDEVYLPYWVCTYPPNVQIMVNAATGRVNI